MAGLSKKEETELFRKSSREAVHMLRHGTSPAAIHRGIWYARGGMLNNMYGGRPEYKLRELRLARAALAAFRLNKRAALLLLEDVSIVNELRRLAVEVQKE